MMGKICFNCFQEIEEDSKLCPLCGYDHEQGSKKYIQTLPCNTILQGRFIVGRVLGQGGFGITYVAIDYQTGKRVAIKEYFPKMLSVRTDVETVSSYPNQVDHYEYGKDCFLDEAKVMAELVQIPNIVHVQQYFEENGTAYFVMDYLEGKSLEEMLEKPLSWEELKKYMLPVLSALSLVHQKGIIHRDVAPDNIFITKDGQVRLLDFGAARYSLGKESQSLDIVLKHGYAPKEQYSRHGRQGAWTDVYAAAAVIYRALTGVMPPDAIDRREGDLASFRGYGADISKNTEQVLMKALAVEAEDRYQNMGEFLNALKNSGSEKRTTMKFDTQKTEEAVKDEKQSDEIKKSGWKKWVVGAVAGIALIAGGVTVGMELEKQKSVAAVGEKEPAIELGEIDLEENEPTIEQGEEYSKEDKIPEIVDDIADADVGDYILFGSYEQDNDLSNGTEPIQWRVLEKEDEKALVISEKVLEVMPYHEKQEMITWADCTLQTWLNRDFYIYSFSEAEKKQVLSQTIETPRNPIYENYVVEDVVNKVFLLSIEEANEYFTSNEERKASKSEYAGKLTWWLRSNGDGGERAAYVSENGIITYYGVKSKGNLGVRPALYISY